LELWFFSRLNGTETLCELSCALVGSEPLLEQQAVMSSLI